MEEKGFFAGLDLSKFYENSQNSVLVSVTEKRTKEQIDSFVKACKEVLS